MFLPHTCTHTHTLRNTREGWEVLGMSVTLVVVMRSQVFASVQTHHIVHIKYMQFFVSHLYLNKAVSVKVEKVCPVKQIEGKERAS